MRIKFTAFAVAAAGLSLLSGCHTAEAPKYSDLARLGVRSPSITWLTAVTSFLSRAPLTEWSMGNTFGPCFPLGGREAMGLRLAAGETRRGLLSLTSGGGKAWRPYWSTQGPNMRCSEPGHSATVALVASREPGG
jgi:hypothetical protein